MDELRNLAAELGPEDGSNPREFHVRPWNSPRQAGRKTQQLCGQVKDALHLALGECANGVLQGLQVVAVEPAPHAGRLRVLIIAATGDRAVAETAVLRASGWLRSQIAMAINRRYVPELVFDVIG
jgi:ribosome-binding factor A